MIRVFDFVFSFLGLLFGFPLLVVLAIIGLFDTGSPIFRQVRVGRNQKPFTLVKFRTMKVDTASVATHLASSASVTQFGSFLRRTKLDELPQLWNVAKGDMSFVGPRPETPDYIQHYNPEQMAILEIRPGITDFASIEFADLGSLLNGDDPDKLYFEKVWDRKMELRMKYVRQRSFWVDIKLIFLTFAAIFNRK